MTNEISHLTTTCHRERSVAISGKEIASTTPQVWLVAGSHLGFAKKSCWGFAMTRFAGKNREQVQKGCHGEEITTLCFLHGS
jgi:hypothetical protein